MSNKHRSFGHVSDIQTTGAASYAVVYYYLLAGIALAVTVFFFLPKT